MRFRLAVKRQKGFRAGTGLGWVEKRGAESRPGARRKETHSTQEIETSHEEHAHSTM